MSLGASGRLGQTVVYKHNRGIAYAAVYTPQPQVLTYNGLRWQGLFGEGSSAWSALTETQREAWRRWALDMRKEDGFLGGTYNPAAYAWFMGLRALQRDCGGTITGEPPGTLPPSMPQEQVVTWDDDAEAWKVEFTPAALGGEVHLDMWRNGPHTAGRFPGPGSIRHFLYGGVNSASPCFFPDRPSAAYYSFEGRALDGATGFGSVKLRHPAVLASAVDMTNRVLDCPVREPAHGRIVDLSGGNNHGIITDCTWVQDGQKSRALYFDGSGSYVDFGNDASLCGGGPLTWEVCVRSGQHRDQNRCILRQSDGVNTRSLIILAATGLPAYYDTIEGAGMGGATAIDDGVWHHVVVSMKMPGDVANLFIDGELVAGAVHSGSTVRDDNLLAGHDDVLLGAGHFDGDLCQFKVWDRALTAGDVEDRHNKLFS
jgi:hypothetical protein